MTWIRANVAVLALAATLVGWVWSFAERIGDLSARLNAATEHRERIEKHLRWNDKRLDRIVGVSR